MAISHFFRTAAYALTALALSVGQAAADFAERRSADDVATVMDRLQAAVEGAGATVFARVDHGAGAASVDLELADAQLLIFGNPRLGTPAMQDDIRSGLVLPLRVLVYEDGAESVILWEPPVDMLADYTTSEGAEYLQRMTGALENLTEAAAGGS
ncbi:MAG: DUF302 domain-containing protein [Pseudomonadota bacterium]